MPRLIGGKGNLCATRPLRFGVISYLLTYLLDFVELGTATRNLVGRQVINILKL
jgi:hypothetical protein